MYVTLTDIQNGELVYLTRSLSGELEVALCKQLTYYHLWHYIRGTERVSNEHTTMLVPDGYYNAHELDEEVFKPLGAKLHLDTYTGLLQLITTNDKIVISSELAKVLGFSQNTFDAEKMLLTNVRPDPAKHTPLTSHTGWPSIGRSTFTLLNWVPPKTWLTASPVRCSDLFPSKTKNGVPGELYHFKSCNIKGLRQVLFRYWLFHLETQRKRGYHSSI